MKVSKLASPYLNVRLKPDGAKIGRAIPGSDLTVLSIENNWAKLPLYVGDSLIIGNAYVNAAYLENPLPPPPLISKFQLGLHVMSNANIASAEAQKGCRYFMIMDNFLGAHQIKTAFPDATVMVRKYIRNRVPPEDMVRALEVYPESRLVYTGHNESDVIGTSPEAIVERAKFDIALATLIKKIAPNAKYAAGTFSRGEPDITNPKINEAIASAYAPAFNSGLIDWDQHTYSSTKGISDFDKDWLLRRWEFLFTYCNFNPSRIGSIYMGETGLDNGAVKGFPGLGITQEEFTAWCARAMQVFTTPMVIGGVSYPSPVVGGAIFQIGGNGDPQWNSFDVSGYTESLRRFYA